MSTLPLPKKADVRRSFDYAAHTYDEHAFLQREIADRLFERLDYIKLAPKHVLELGCGTGYATRKLRARYPEAALTAVDLAPEMCRVAAAQMPKAPLLARMFKSAPTTEWLCADAEKLPMADESVDLIVSNLTLQWCDPEAVARECARVLRPEGLVMFTTFGPDTLKELRTAFRAVDDKPHVNTFVDMHDIGDMLVAAGFADPVMDQEVVTITYSELKTLMRELKGIGAHNVLPDRQSGLMGKQRWAALVNAYERFRRAEDGKLPTTYEVVYGHAWKPAFTKRKTVDGQQVIGLGEFKRMVQKS
ncbi:MAG: malonyl-ACP O-methyltransferase BioC [Burkholderiales bacterium]